MLFKVRRLNRIKRMSKEKEEFQGWDLGVLQHLEVVKEEEPIKETGSWP